MNQKSGYTGRKIALLTQHGKERVIAPVLEPGRHCLIEHVTGFDTDQLGTFTRETPRIGTQLDAARRKARKGMELTGLSLGLASEGSFGVDPFTGMFPWNIELLVWVDDESGIEVTGMAQGVARSGHILSSDWREVKAFAERESFPQYQLVMRPNDQDNPHIHKGIADWSRLESCFEDCISKSITGQVFVELDLRAFANPRRMQHIEQAARDLLQRIQSKCPDCETPGFWVTERKPGLPCWACGSPTSSYQIEVWRCLKCDHHSVRSRTDKTLKILQDVRTATLKINVA
jgi:hypothetical protein